MDDLKVIPPIIVGGPSIGWRSPPPGKGKSVGSAWRNKPIRWPHDSNQICLNLPMKAMRDLALHANQALRFW